MDTILSIPVNKEFSSLNLSHAVLLVCYFWEKKYDLGYAKFEYKGFELNRSLAKKSDLFGLFDQLERELVKGGFLYPPEKAPTMIKNLRSIFLRSKLNEQEVKTLRGVISAIKRSGKLD